MYHENVIVYTNRCLTCRRADRQRIEQLKSEAKKLGVKLEIKRVDFSREWRAESDVFGKSLPFYVHGGVALNFYGQS